jgi:Protein of unknown function (DUF3293)
MTAPLVANEAQSSRVLAALIAAYRATHYCVNGGAPSFLLKVDEYSADLEECQRAHGVSCSAFLTAWNPWSRATAHEVNHAAQRELATLLAARGYRTLDGLGVDPTGQWEGEESFLVLGIGCDEAIELGRQFRQNGILWAAADAVPRLVLLE